MYTSTIVDDEAHCMEVMQGMEDAFGRKDESYFIRVLKEEPSLVLRVHAVCILADVGQEESVPALSDVLFHDPDPLVRHEAAFSLGQIGLSSAVKALEKAATTDRDPIVRHEAAAALGSIGNPSAESALRKALSDKEAIVSNSARASLFNIEFLKKYSTGKSARERAPRP
jgi:deoxyhypusine monooxygenase